MNMKKLLSLVLAMLLALSALAFAEEAQDDLQARLDAANARVAELEALVELYKPYYEKQVVAEFGEDGVIWRDDAMKEYEAAASAYAQYGLSIDDYADGIKEDILKSLVKSAVIDAKAEALGLSNLDDETIARLQTEATETFENYVDSYRSYFAAEDATDEEAREQTLAALESYGMTQDALTQQTIDGYVDEQLYNYVTADVAVTDEDIKAKYDAMVAEAQESYADDYSYNNARNSGNLIVWNPEGYRAVKHVLIKFDDAQAKQYSELHSTLDSLNAELEALNAPAETETPVEIEDADVEVEEAPVEEAEATPEATPGDRGPVQPAAAPGPAGDRRVQRRRGLQQPDREIQRRPRHAERAHRHQRLCRVRELHHLGPRLHRGRHVHRSCGSDQRPGLWPERHSRDLLPQRHHPRPGGPRGHRRRREGRCPAGQDRRDLRQPGQRLDRGGQAGLPRGSVLIHWIQTHPTE